MSSFNLNLPGFPGLNKFQDKFYGIYSGYVEANDDPIQLARIKVRVHAAYGDNGDLSTAEIPWAKPCNPFGGGSDYGSITVPPVGSLAWVMFEGGDIHHPVWMGTWTAIPDESRPITRDSVGEHPPGPASMSPSEKKPWSPPPGPEAPKEFQVMQRGRPETHVVFKSPKGASIIIDDRDQNEKITIQDRSGQTISMACPISYGANINNVSQRGTKTSEAGDSLPIERSSSQEGIIALVDIGGQSLELVSKKSSQNVGLVDSSANDILGQEINPSKPKEDIAVNWSNSVKLISRQPTTKNKNTRAGNKDNTGQRAIVMEMSSSDNNFSLRFIPENNGQVVTEIQINGNDGTVTINAPSTLTIKAQNTVLDGNLHVQKDIVVNGNAVVLQNMLVADKLVHTPTIDETPEL